MRNLKKLIFMVSFSIVFLLLNVEFNGQEAKETPEPILSCPEVSILGQTIQVKGQNFALNTTYIFKWSGRGDTFICKGELRSNTEGNFTGEIVLPSYISQNHQGEGILSAYDKKGGSRAKPAGQHSLIIERAVLTAPETSTIGKTIRVEGQNFAPNTTYNFKWGVGNRQFSCQEEMKTDEQGTFSGEIVLPAVLPATFTARNTLLFAYDKTYGRLPIAWKSVVIERAVLTAPDRSTIGKTIQVEGQNFAPNTTYNFKWGVGNRQFSCQEEMKTDEQGTFSGEIVLPAVLPATFTARNTLLFAYDKTYGRLPIAWKSVVIERAVLTAPDRSTIGKTIQVEGQNFAPNTTYIFKWGLGDTQIPCTGEMRTDEQGVFAGEIVLPSIVFISEWNQTPDLYIYDKTYEVLPIARKQLARERAVLEAPASAKPGETIPVTGKYLAPETTYIFKWGSGPRQWICQGEAKTDDEGNLSGDITLPSVILSYQPGAGSRYLHAYDKVGGFSSMPIGLCKLKIEWVTLDFDSTEIEKYLDPGETFEVGKYILDPNLQWAEKPLHYTPKESDSTSQLINPAFVCKDFHLPINQSDLVTYGFPEYYLRYKNKDYVPVIIYESSQKNKVVGHLVLDSAGNVIKDYETIFAVFNIISVLGGKDSGGHTRTSTHLKKEAVYYRALAFKRMEDSEEMQEFGASWGVAARLATDVVAIYFSLQTGDWWGAAGAALSAMNTVALLTKLWAMTNEDVKVENWVNTTARAKLVPEIAMNIKDLKPFLDGTAELFTLRRQNLDRIFVNYFDEFNIATPSATMKAHAQSVAGGVAVAVMDAASREVAEDAHKCALMFTESALAYYKISEVLLNAADGIEDLNELEDTAYLGILASYAAERDKILVSHLVNTQDTYLKADWRGWVYGLTSPVLRRAFGGPSPDEVRKAGEKMVSQHKKNAEDFREGFYHDFYLTVAETARTEARIEAKEEKQKVG